MIVFWAALLCIGMLLVASPWLWPKNAERAPSVKSESTLHRLLAEAGLSRISASGFLAIIVALAAVAGIVALLITRMPALAVLAAVAGAAAPLVWARAQRQRRLDARRTLWPDICDLLVASVRAGMGIPDAVASLSVSAPAAVRPAFATFQRDLHASGHFDSSVLTLKATLADATADRIVETLRMARQVGGTELPSVLRALSAAVRAETAVRGEVAARQSWIRGAAIVGVIAPWAILGLLVTRPEGAAAYSTPLGALLILVAAVVSVVAFRVMIRIGRLPEPRRWFG